MLAIRVTVYSFASVSSTSLTEFPCVARRWLAPSALVQTFRVPVEEFRRIRPDRLGFGLFRVQNALSVRPGRVRALRH